MDSQEAGEQRRAKGGATGKLLLGQAMQVVVVVIVVVV